MNTASDFIIDGQTLTPSGVITVSGTPISLDSTPTGAVVGQSTEALGSVIIAGFGGGPSASAPTILTGAAPRVERRIWESVLGAFVLGILSICI